MILRLLLIAQFLYLSFFSYAQCPDALKKAVFTFHEHLLSKNTNALELLCSDNLNYMHSNLWLETKKDLLENNASRYLEYTVIKIDSVTCYLDEKTAAVRFSGEFAGLKNGNPFNLKLNVLQCWVMKKKKWNLLARQALKIQ